MQFRISKIFICSVLCLTWGTKTFAQDLLYQTITADDGLPSSEVYRIIQDQKGYIWIGSTNGLAKYNGRTFTVFTTENGLPNNEVVDLIRGQNNDIFVITLSNKIAHVHGDSIEEVKYKISHSDSFYFSNTPLGFSQDKKGQNWIYSRNQERLILLDSNNVSTTNESHPSANSSADYILHLFPGQKILQKSPSILKPKPNPIVKQKDGILRINGLGRGDFRFDHLVGQSVIGIAPDGDYVYWDGDSLRQGKFDYKHILKVKQDKDMNIWVLTTDGVFFYEKGNLSKHEHFFKGHFITDLLHDHEGNLWLADHNLGLHKIQSLGLRKYASSKTQGEHIAEIKVRNNELWIGTINGKISKLGSDLKCQPIYADPRRAYDFYSFEVMKTGELFLPGGSIYDPSNKSYKVKPLLGHEAFKSIKFTASGLTVGATQGLIYFDSVGSYTGASYGTNLSTDRKLAKENKFSYRTNAICQLDSTLWIGCVDGLYKSIKGVISRVGDSNSVFRLRVMDICILPDNRIALASKGGGITVYNPSTKAIKIINEKNGLLSNSVSKLLYANGKLYAGSNKGLTVFQWSEDGNPAGLWHFTKNSGLSSNEVFSLGYFDQKVWIGTKNGMLYLQDHTLISQESDRPIYLSRISDGANSIPINGHHISLKAKQRNITFYYDDISFQQAGNSQYRYILKNSGEDTTFSTVREARYTNLEPGEYEFIVWTQNGVGKWSEVPARVTFTIPKMYFETSWFQAVVAIILTSLLGLVFWLILMRRKRSFTQKLQTVELRQQALTAMMNPHFINNSLSAIQLLVNKGDMQKSNDFIARFARLIRQNLNSIRDGAVSLEDEISSLDLYLHIEKSRVGEKLNYSIDYDEDEDLSTLMIPSMIIQPFVENAIWHGILPLERPGFVRIEFQVLSDELLEVIVMDDGVGLDNKSSNPSEHKSLSTELIKERLELLDITSEHKHSITLEPNSDGAGTKVTINLPILQ